VDLTAFEAAVNTAVTDTEARDKDTGELPPALIEPVNAEFRKLEGAKAKNKARARLNELMKETMNKLDMPLARSYMILTEHLSAGSSGGSSPKAPADPTEAFVQRMVGLQLAVGLAKSNVPEGVSEDWTEKANALYGESEAKAIAYLQWANSSDDDKGEEPEASAVVKSAVKLAQGKSAKVGGAVRSGGGGSGDGVRRDIGKHIEAAFADVESGTFLTVAQIRAHKSEEYGDNPPSAGAISARLFPNSGKGTSVPGITAGHNENNKKGAMKD
jgi:hypothetical protein